jgi:hypothetical protein
MLITIPVSVGELLDKITILMIKYEHSKNIEVGKELNKLSGIAKEFKVLNDEFIQVLYHTNLILWNIEDTLRELEKENEFSEEFVDLARSVYKTNDLRSKIKKEINEFYGSEITEYKSYK